MDFPTSDLNGHAGEDIPEPDDPFTPEQEERIKELIRSWAVAYGLIEGSAEDE